MWCCLGPVICWGSFQGVRLISLLWCGHTNPSVGCDVWIYLEWSNKNIYERPSRVKIPRMWTVRYARSPAVSAPRGPPVCNYITGRPLVTRRRVRVAIIDCVRASISLQHDFFYLSKTNKCFFIGHKHIKKKFFYQSKFNYALKLFTRKIRSLAQIHMFLVPFIIRSIKLKSDSRKNTH